MERDRHVIAWSCEFGLACLLLVGCDKLADLDELDPPPREAGAGSDVITSEDGDDAITCVGRRRWRRHTGRVRHVSDRQRDRRRRRRHRWHRRHVRSASGHRHRQRRVLHAVSESRQLAPDERRRPRCRQRRPSAGLYPARLRLVRGATHPDLARERDRRPTRSSCISIAERARSSAACSVACARPRRPVICA